MGLKVKSLLHVLQEEGAVRISEFCQSVTAFYDTCIKYLTEWGKNFNDLLHFSWVLLRKVPLWEDVQTSLQFVSLKLEECDIDETGLFDETSCMRKYTSDRIAQWNKENKSVDERWVEIFTHFRNEDIAFKNISLIVQFAM